MSPESGNPVDSLIQEGFLQITSRGRLATEKAFRYFQKKLPLPQKRLF